MNKVLNLFQVVYVVFQKGFPCFKITFYFNMFVKHNKVHSISSLLILARPSTGTFFFIQFLYFYIFSLRMTFFVFFIVQCTSWRIWKEIYIIKLFAHIYIFVYIYVRYSGSNSWTKLANLKKKLKQIFYFTGNAGHFSQSYLSIYLLSQVEKQFRIFMSEATHKCYFVIFF